MSRSKSFRLKALSFIFAVLASFFIVSNAAWAAPAYIINSTGGDCASIGTWNSTTQTCTLNQNLTVNNNDGIQIANNGITLDGAMHGLTGNNTGGTNGVTANALSNVNVKNLIVRNFDRGINFTNISSGSLTNNVMVYDLAAGLSITTSTNIQMTGNNSNFNTTDGIFVSGGLNNSMTGNTVENNANVGINLQAGPANQTIQSNFIFANGSSLTQNINMTGASNSVVRGNRIVNAPGQGIFLSGATNNAIFNNVFQGNNTQAAVSGGSGNRFFGGLSPGNYWSDYNTPTQGCHDMNADGVCDAAYVFSGGTDPAPLTLPYAFSSYYWTWYDNVESNNWILLGNRQLSASDEWFDLKIAGSFITLPPITGYQPGQVPPGSVITPMYGGIMNGPVIASARSGGNDITSQRVLWPQGGSSLEEVPGTPGGLLSDIFYWTWYDQQSAGMTDWILVSNPNNYTIYYEISIPGMPTASGAIAAGGKVTPTFPGIMGGPVKVEAWTDNTKTEPSRVMASQRVLTGGGSAFNELPGTPGAALSSDYHWTWYDMTGSARNWVLVANPTNAAAPIYYTIKIGGTAVVSAGGPIAPGGSATPVFPGTIGGPVEVTTYTDPANPGATAAKAICSQRSLWGPSFEEVPGLADAMLRSHFGWTWYDQMSAGMKNWVLVANPTASSIYFEITVGSTLQDSGTIAAGGSIQHVYSGLMGGPVEVRTWTDSSKTTNANSFASQRVLYNGFFNEVWGQ